MQGAQPAEVFFGREQILDSRRMADPQQVAGQFMTLGAQGHTVKPYFASRWLHQARQQAQQAGFAAAVGAADLQHVAAGQTQFEVFEQHPPVTLTSERYGF